MENTITLTEKQYKGLQACKQWYESGDKKPFVIMGVAGAGKTVLVRFIVQELNLNESNVSYVTFTGKAASVLTSKGNKATTIHKLIYDPISNEEEKQKAILEGKIKPEDIKKNDINFIKKSGLPENLELIIVDEFFMVSNDIMEDLLSFGIRIIALGDPCQLPPPFGNTNNLYKHPDVILDEPLRQSLDNPIIYLANKARNHERITVGDYGNSVIVTDKSHMLMENFKNANQIIACKNATVKKLNNFYRKKILNINDVIPIKGEKLICLRNNWGLECAEEGQVTNMINGLNCYLESDISINKSVQVGACNLRPEFFNDHNFKNILIDLLYFKHNYNKEDELWDPNNIERYNYKPNLTKRNILFEDKGVINKFTYGYTVTCHKMQGSEVKDAYFIFEPLGRNTYWELLYTGITRASEKLTLVI